MNISEHVSLYIQLNFIRNQFYRINHQFTQKQSFVKHNQTYTLNLKSILLKLNQFLSTRNKTHTNIKNIKFKKYITYGLLG